MAPEAGEEVVNHRSIIASMVIVAAALLLPSCPTPQVETGAVCTDTNHNTCETCASTRACAWCFDPEEGVRCIARDPALGQSCPEGARVARVTEACEPIEPAE